MAIPDQYVVLLEKTMKENKKLQESISNLSRHLSSPESNVTSVSQSPTATTPKRPNSMKIPEHCRRLVRDCYASLLKREDFNGFELSLTFGDSANFEVKRRVIRAVQDISSSSEGCPYSLKVITEATRRYFKTLKDAKHKKDTGKEQEHLIKCRRQARVNENSKRMKIGLSRKTWNVEKKQKIAKTLSTKYLDEEISDYELSENGSYRVGFQVKKVTWIHENVREIHRELMEEYIKSLIDQQKQQFCQRIIKEGEKSQKEKPKDCPDWVLNGLI